MIYVPIHNVGGSYLICCVRPGIRSAGYIGLTNCRNCKYHEKIKGTYNKYGLLCDDAYVECIWDEKKIKDQVKLEHLRETHEQKYQQQLLRKKVNGHIDS